MPYRKSSIFSYKVSSLGNLFTTVLFINLLNRYQGKIDGWPPLTNASKGRSLPSSRLPDAKFGRSASQRPVTVSRVPTASASRGSRPGTVRILDDRSSKTATERGRGRSRPSVTHPRSARSQSPIMLTTTSSKGNETATSVVHIVGDGNIYNLKKIDLQVRTASDLQRIVSQYTKIPAKLHSFALGNVELALEKTLYSQGVRDKSEIGLSIKEFIAVIAVGNDGNELELRFHGMDPGIVLCGQLRRAVSARMQSPFPITLMNVDGSFIPDSADDMPLQSLGVVNGYTLRATASNLLSPSSKEQASGFISTYAVSDAPYPKTLSVKSKWPISDTNTIQLFVETDGIWSTGSLSQADKKTSKIPLPPLKSRSNITDVRGVLYDLLGIQEVSQVLFVRDGNPLPQHGTDRARLPLVGFLKQNDTLILAIDNSWKVKGTPVSPKIIIPQSMKLPWCISCIVCDAKQPHNAEWRPQFVQPTWLVEDLIAVVALEFDSEVGMISMYFRGQELDFSSNLQSQELDEGSVILVLIRTVLDLNVDIRLDVACDRGSVFKTTLRGVPPAAVVSELCKRALKACTLDEFSASQFIISVGGMVLPDSTPLRCCRISHQTTISCVQKSIPNEVSPSVSYLQASGFSKPREVSYRPATVHSSPQSVLASPHVNWPPPPVSRS